MDKHDYYLVDGFSYLGQRENQQDCYVYQFKEKQMIAVLCDGMGGIQGGEKASHEACHYMEKNYRAASTMSNGAYFFESIVQDLDQRIFQLMDDKGKWLGAGTTIAAVYIQDKDLYWMSVGDSKIFICRGKDMLSVAKEHNYRTELDALYRSGKVSRNDYERDKVKGDQLTSYLGMGNISQYDINHTPFMLLPGDRILLCSDGVYRTLCEKELKETMMTQENVSTCCMTIEALIKKKKIEKQDNATGIVIEYQREGENR